MIRFALCIMCVIACIASLSCQSYTTGLQQSAGRVDETAVIGSLRTIGVAQRSYSVSNGGDYGTFQQLSEAGYLDSRFNSSKPEVKGYALTMNVGEKSFSCNADPAITGGQQARHFYIDSTSGEIHANPSQPATAADPAL